MLRKLLTSLALSLTFLILYALTNHFASLRPVVPSLFLPWERHIPFLPLFILPYLSLDLFFIASPFLCKTPRELATLRNRILAAILTASAFFLAFPLKFAFNRPPSSFPLFNQFRSLDQPFDEFPSLHVALTLILLATYCRHTRGIARLLLTAWFALIFLSPIFTYQHHLIDILGGTFLAFLCLHLLQDTPLRTPFLPNYRVALYYALAALLLTALSLTFTPYTLALLVPAFSLALTSAAYAFLGPGIYRKTAGTLPLTSYLLLWPILLGQYLSLLHYSRKCRPFDRLTSGILIGRRLNPHEAQSLRSIPIAAILDLTAEFPETKSLRRLPYLNLPLLDLTAPTPEQIHQALAFIHLHTTPPTLSSGIPAPPAPGIPRASLYIHCKIGYSRTATIAALHLLTTGTPQSQLLPLLQKARPQILLRPEAQKAIQQFATCHPQPISAPASPIPSPK